jgi:hypothetical protein
VNLWAVGSRPHLAVHRPATVEKLVLNTAGGWKAHPQVMERLKKLSNEAASDPFWDGLTARLHRECEGPFQRVLDEGHGPEGELEKPADDA